MEYLKISFLTQSMILCVLHSFISTVIGQDIVGCGGFVQSTVPINFERVEVKLYTKTGALKFKTECAPNNGYFLVAVYDKGEYTLRIEPPNGWGFNPTEIDLNIDGKTDPCVKGQDINFKFTGFSVGGLIGSKNRAIGPAGVDIQLQGAGEDIRKNVTVENGLFSFANVMPGTYELKASHPVWTIQQDAKPVVVKDENVYYPGLIMVSGYDVKGHVRSAGEPIQGVIFVLFAEEKTQMSGCTELPEDVAQKLAKRVNLPQICSVLSGEDGVFVFPSVPSGDYTLVPYYSSQGIVFDVVPTKITFQVNLKSVMLKTPFQVHGFSVTGKIIDTEGKGIQGVTVNLGKDTKPVITNFDGVYLVENVTSGTYQIEASIQNLFFDKTEVHINPNSPHIADIQVKKFSVCGVVEISFLPPGLSQIGQRKVMLLRSGMTNADMVTVTADAQGKFCFQAAPGKYQIEVLISPSEAKAGLKLVPSAIEVDIKNQPVLDLSFKQFLASVSGNLKCIGSCDDSKVTLSSVDRPGQEKFQSEIERSEKGTTFSFDKILPGKYKLTPVREKWCWEPRNLEIEVKDSNLHNLQLNHVGFLLKCVLSHNVTLNFALEGSSAQVGSFSLKMGKNKFCLTAAGIYHLTPISCYKFDQDVYMYDTSNPKELALSVVKYKLVVTVKSQKKLDDVSLTIRSTRSNTDDTITPVLLRHEAAQQSTSNDTKPVDIDQVFEYQGIYWARANEEVKVTATSKEVLFNPSTKTTVIQGNCPGGKLEFEGKEGIFIKGTVSPPLKDVLITVKTSPTENHKESRTIATLTDESGAYSVGPMHSDILFEVSAKKAGYVISETSTKGTFAAMKLGQITVKIVDESDKPMQGVLLSLSGGQYRSNTITPENGVWSFINLSPGQFFLRPMQKEYNFEPNSQMIDVKEGEEVQIDIKGKRVAFSFIGSVTTLAGDPEKSIAVEAVGLDKCSEFHEETVTDASGLYRLRGLHPDCEYDVKVKLGDSNPHIERAGPTSLKMKVGSADVEQINFIVFYKPKAFELTASIDTEMEWLSHIKVLLYREDNFDSPVHSVSPGHVKFVQFPPLPLDNQFYVVRLESTLSKKTHNFDSTSASFTTGGSFKKHVELKVNVTKKKLELEPTQSVLALPLTIILFVLGYNYEVVMAFFSRVRKTLKGDSQDKSENGADETNKSKKKKK
ncbi:BOS complex subunit NOMO1-like [Rhopilema esculentum]|uniref:BOS complex subunit NOMO1-like n=1 Tax=Rhopilema esculentum TaxID=499914 RepID=UPI0031E1EE37